MRHMRFVTLLAAALAASLPALAQSRDAKSAKPEEDMWAIRAIAFQGPQRFELGEQWAGSLKAARGIRANLVQVLSDEQETVVYYGKYKRKYDAVGNVTGYEPDHLKDMKLIRELSITVKGHDGWPFINASLEPLPTPASHPEWDLEKAEGYWSLHVAVFFNDQNMRSRRYAAEEYCRQLRGEGHEAYFHHGTTNSSVCVGLFPRNAIQEFKEENKLTGVVTFRNKVVDPRLVEMQRKFPHSLQNGRIMHEVIRDPKTNEVKDRIPWESFPIATPRAEDIARTQEAKDKARKKRLGL